MLLAVDIGNSNIVLGVWDENRWISTIRFVTHPVKNKRYKKKVINGFNKMAFDINQISDTIISSVVPEATKPVADALKPSLNKEPKLFDTTFNTGIKIETDHPEKVGIDLIADAAGAYHLAQNSCIVVDFGTATTIMAVEQPGVLKGVAICVGLKGAKESLVGGAAQLFDVPLQPSSSVLGKNTIEAMQSGLVVGHIAMVEGLIERMKKEVEFAKVVATGGLVETLAPLTDTFDYIEPSLTLDGLRLILERHLQNNERLKENFNDTYDETKDGK